MTFAEYVELEKRAEAVGLGGDPCLLQLLHFLQFSEVVRRSHEACMRELRAWEKNISKEVERRVKEAEL